MDVADAQRNKGGLSLCVCSFGVSTGYAMSWGFELCECVREVGFEYGVICVHMC